MSEPQETVESQETVKPQEIVEPPKPPLKWTDLLKMTAEQNPDFAEKMHYWIVKRRRQPEFHYLLSWVVATFGAAKTTEYITQILENNTAEDAAVQEALRAQDELAQDK